MDSIRSYFIINYLLAVWFLTFCHCHVNHRGACPKLLFPMQDFDADKFLGEWHVARSFDPDASCLVFNYTRCGEFCLRVTESRQLDAISRIGVSNVYRTDGYLNINRRVSAEMRASFRTNPAPAVYTVLETDYDHMAVVFTCQNVGLSGLALYHRRDVYLMIRNTNDTFSPEHITKLSNSLIKNEIEDEFSAVSQSGCLEPSQATLDLNASQLGQRVSQVAHTVTMGLGSLVNTVTDMFTSNREEPASVGVAPLR